MNNEIMARVRVATCWVLSAVLLQMSAAAAELQMLKAGAARVDITPTTLTGVAFAGRSYKSVHDPIFARALVIDNGAVRAAVVSLDLVETGDTTELRRRIERSIGIPVDHIMITATHDHSAPRAGAVTPGGIAHPSTPETEAYTRQVYDGVVAAVTRAKAALQPARFGFATGRADININRDEYTGKKWIMGFNPDGPSDKTVAVLKFEKLSGDPIAVIINYGVHSTALSAGSEEVSGDIAGAAERYVEARYGDATVALWAIGAGGDQNPRFSVGNIPEEIGLPAQRKPPPYDAMNAQGFMVGAEVVRVAEAMTSMQANVRIRAAERIMSCPVKQGTNQQADLKQAAATNIDLHLDLIMLNDVALTGVSGEVVTPIYWHLKRASPLANTLMVTLVNDRVGYIANDAAYDTPTFEVNGTPIARGCAEDSIVTGLVGMINAESD